ncbi:MAG: 50S ribosomal protein L11 methyltransferase [Pyrinomonadaceae bacterium]
MSEKQSTWCLIEITCREEADEAVEFALNELGALGTEINTLGKSRDATIVVNGYFNERIDDEVVADNLNYALQIHGLTGDLVERREWSEIENADWLAEWKKYWRPTEIGRFVITPPWEAVAESDKIVIRIEPNMAFGTGTHETTQLCLKAIGEKYQSEDSFFDVGTGTGILAIGAAKLGGTRILACDTDLDSVKIAVENAAANGVGNRIEFRDGSLSNQTAVHDFVCANLTIDAIVPILPLLVEKSGSILLLSGILVEQENIIVEELKKHKIADFVIESSGEWISVLITK